MTAASPGPGEAGSAVSSSSPGSAFGSPKIGTSLGRYEIVGTLGHGAMATVFRARDTQLGRDVAIKVMGMVHAARGGAGERFRREAHAVAALKHPAIVEIYDFVSATENEPSYIVVELIQGPSLRTLLEERGGRFLPEIAALIALPLAEALAAAHEHGVIHRDVKPDNVMIEVSGESSRVVLTDFGVAHITGMETMTATGALVGSPAYMSPEQSRGQEVTPAADLWSFGAMLYELVTGVVPFSGKDPFTMIAAILRGTFRRPSQVVASVGPDFEAMIMRCLKASPAERYASASALAADLREFARVAGLLPEGKSLRRFLDEPEAILADLRPRVADRAVAQARQFARRGQLARALAEIGHATAYVPNHAGADKLLRRLSASRTAIKIAVVAAGLLAALGIILLARPLLPLKTPVPVAPVAAPAASQPRPMLVPADKVPAAPPTPATVPSAATAPSAAAKSRTSRRPHAVSSPSPVPAVEPTPVSEPSPPPPAVEPAPPRHEAEQTRYGTIALFAKSGFCYPSLDDHPAGDLMPVFRDIAPGKHRIYCSRTRQSPRELVGEVDLAPGAKIERTVTEQDGRFILARPR
ncbi:MAG TPA: serine/threonine-protein kinase [Polyangia bacterium]